MEDTTSKVSYMINSNQFIINEPIPQYHGHFYKQYTIPKHIFDMAIKEYLPDLIKNNPDIRNMISDIIGKEDLKI